MRKNPLLAKLFNRYQIENRLGEGAQSTVYLVRDNQNENVQKAAKVLKGDYLKQHSDEGLIQEFHLLESVDHQNLVRVYECRFLPKDKAPVLITEYVPGAKDLEIYIKNKKDLPFSEKLQIFYQILSALRYLHSKKIIHGDLKPSNILVGQEEGIPYPVVKLIDFGVSYDLLVKQKKKRVGTPYYIAPEAVSEGIQMASDLYSLGVILYRMFISPSLPYKGKGVQTILSDHLQGISLFNENDFEGNTVPKIVLDFIKQCLKSDPLERPRRLGNILRELRFEFEETLEILSSSVNDTRLRYPLGMNPSMSIAKQFIREHCLEVKTTAESHRHLLFVSAPSGGGKTRFLAEISKFCQKEKFHHQTLTFKPFDFWSHTVLHLMQVYSQTKTVKRMRGRIFQIIKSREPLQQRHLFSRFIQNLAQELGGLIILVDGVNTRLPTTFLETLKKIVSSQKVKNTFGKGKSPTRPYPKLAFILTVNNRPISNKLECFEDHEKITKLMNELTQSFIDQRKYKLEIKNENQALEQWKQIPEEIRSLGLEGLAHLLSLPPWGKEDLLTYFGEVFPENEFSDDFFDKLLEKTKGNPGILQALCNEALKNIPGGQTLPPNIIQALLFELSREGKVHDLHVYKLKHYDDHGKTLLALLAALEASPKPLIEEVWTRLFKEQGKQEALKILIRAYDDGLIQINRDFQTKAFHYMVNNQNLRNELQEYAREFSKPIGFLLRKILKQGESFLNSKHHLFLARFLGIKKIWAKSLLTNLENETSTSKRLALEPFLSELRKELANHFDFNEVNWDTRLRLDFVALESLIFRYHYDEAIDLAKNILNSINDRNDPFANGLRAKTQLNLGNLYRIMPDQNNEAIEYLKEAVDSELLTDRDHYYALGAMALCQLRTEAVEKQPEILDYLNHARKELRNIDIIRYAILTESLAGFYMDHKKYQKALPYLELTARLFGEVGETLRQIRTQRRIGKIYNSLKRCPEALNILERTLPIAERMGNDGEAIEILINIIRTCYNLGDFRKFVPACLHLTSICERSGDIHPLTTIMEYATHAFIENGQYRKALDFVRSQLKALQNSKDLRKDIDIAICQLLLLNIYQKMGNWNEAHKQNHLAKEKIEDLLKMNFCGDPFHQNQARFAHQVHEFYYLELIRNDYGPKKALEKIELFFSQNLFEGSLLNEAYLKAFQYCVWAEEIKKAEKYIPRCLQFIKQCPAPDRMSFFTHLGKFYLDQNDLQKAEKILRKAAGLLNMVTNHVFRAQLYDQQARLASRHGNRNQALQKWNLADQEFKLNSQTWETNDRERYKETSSEWQEHRVIYMLMQTSIQ